MSEWGPWIDHDGKGCPVVGKYIQVEAQSTTGKWAKSDLMISCDGYKALFEYMCRKGEPAWDWEHFGKVSKSGQRVPRIIRYRVRKPKGMEMLDKILRDVGDAFKNKTVPQLMESLK